MARACEGGGGGRLWNLEELEGAAKGFHQLFQTSKSESGRKSLVAKGEITPPLRAEMQTQVPAHVAG